MKRLTYLTAYLTVAAGLALAQLPNARIPAAWPISSSISDFAPLANDPFFPGGQSALQTYLKQPELYPASARQNGIEGTVWVQFRVQRNGMLTDVRLLRPHGSPLDGAALHLVAAMPRWYPAHREGHAVSRLVNLPVTFRLDGPECPIQ